MFHQVTTSGFPGNSVTQTLVSLEGHNLACHKHQFSFEAVSLFEVCCIPVPRAAWEVGLSPTDSRLQVAFCLWISAGQSPLMTLTMGGLVSEIDWEKGKIFREGLVTAL